VLRVRLPGVDVGDDRSTVHKKSACIVASLWKQSLVLPLFVIAGASLMIPCIFASSPTRGDTRLFVCVVVNSATLVWIIAFIGTSNGSSHWFVQFRFLGVLWEPSRARP